MKVRRRYIRSLVEKILKEREIGKCPVQIEEVAQAVGVEVRRNATNEPLSGFLLRHGAGKAIIGVNKSHHPNRQRFTIAHELGHYFLHGGKEVHVDESFMTSATISLRGKEAELGQEPEEIEANLFAAEMLMPEVFLKRDLEHLSEKAPPDEEAFEKAVLKLAKKYEVSKQAMTFRLINLGHATY